MCATIASLIVSPNVCSVTDKDGTTILDIGRDRIYSVIGVGSLVWNRLASSPTGVTLKAIIEELSAEFKDVPGDQIELDVERLLAGFEKKGLLKTEEAGTGRFSQTIHNMAVASFNFLSRITIGLLLKLRFSGLAAFFGFAMINIMLKALSFSALCASVKGWPVSRTAAHSEVLQEICDAVDRATILYPKEAVCLQRSAITTCLLRQGGIEARMVIGCRKIPFKAHAWVEVDGQVVNDKNSVQKTYKILDRL
jgi:hypothetical protein